MKEDVRDVKQFLESKGIHPSYYRIKIFEYLLSHRTHPSVDMIFQDLKKEIPTLSKTTIYNTLNLFAEKGLVLVLTIDERETRYDVDTSDHIHFKCVKCGKVYDIFEKVDLSKILKGTKHKVKEVHIYLKGVCESCAEKEAH